MPVALGSPVEEALDQLRDAVDTLTSLDLTAVDRDGLLGLLRGVEAQRRRLPVADHRLVAELDQRGVAGELCARDTKTLLRETLRLSPREAKARYHAAVDPGARSPASRCRRCSPVSRRRRPPGSSPRIMPR